MSVRAASPPPLVFSWAPPRRRARALVFFLIASLLLHAFCFYLFQIVYPPTVALPPAPARLSVITPEDPASIGLLRWIESEDPALATTTVRPFDVKPVALPALTHTPSYATHQPALKLSSETTPDLRVPSVFPPGALRTPAPAESVALPPTPQKTAVLFSDGTRELGAAAIPEMKWSASRPDAPANARFRIALDSHGIVRYIFISESSGDPALDEQARHLLQLVRFPPGENASELTWARASILWGNDLAPHAAPTATPPAAP